MNLRFFIAKRLSYKGRMVTAAVSISFLVVIIAVAVSAGFRHEIRKGFTQTTGDIQLTMSDLNYMDESSPVNVSQSYLPYIADLEGVQTISPVIYRAGIVKNSNDIYGVMLKGIEGGVRSSGTVSADTLALAVSIPSTLAESAGLKTGDKLLTYFIGEKVKVRQFNIADIYEPLVRTDDRHLIYADISDMQRLNGWSDGQASVFEITLSDEYKDEALMQYISFQISSIIHERMSEDDDLLLPVSSVQMFPQVFEWMSLIDFNVLFVLILMIAVAGVNMITGLLILLFENISTIGLFKSLGMPNVQIINVFMTRAAGVVLKGMLIGNAVAFILCFIQSQTHAISLDPVNYFVSYVPVHLDVLDVLAADFIAFVSIMVLMILPSLFILRVDPSKTVKMD